MAEALVETRAAAAIADRTKMAERLDMELLLRGLRCAEPQWFIRLLVGSSAHEVHAIAAKFRPVEVTTRLFTPRSGKRHRPGLFWSALVRPACAEDPPEESGQQSLALPAAGVDFLPPPS
jgi:hypothetical protein